MDRIIGWTLCLIALVILLSYFSPIWTQQATTRVLSGPTNQETSVTKLFSRALAGLF